MRHRSGQGAHLGFARELAGACGLDEGGRFRRLHHAGILADTGGLDTASKKTWNAQGYLGYRMYVADHPAIIRVGYRVLSQDYRTTDFTGNKFKYDVTQRGPVLGLSMRF